MLQDPSDDILPTTLDAIEEHVLAEVLTHGSIAIALDLGDQCEACRLQREGPHVKVPRIGEKATEVEEEVEHVQGVRLASEDDEICSALHSVIIFLIEFLGSDSEKGKGEAIETLDDLVLELDGESLEDESGHGLAVTLNQQNKVKYIIKFSKIKQRNQIWKRSRERENVMLAGKNVEDPRSGSWRAYSRCQCRERIIRRRRYYNISYCYQ